HRVHVHGTLGAVQVAKPREHDCLHVRPAAMDDLEHFQPAHSRQIQIDDEDVDGPVFQDAHAGFGAADGGDVETHVANGALQHVAQAAFVFDHEHAATGRGAFR